MSEALQRPAAFDAAANLAAVGRQIEEARRDSELAAPAVTLVAVSKTKPADLIEQVIAAGQQVFGENRVQEAAEKWPALKARHSDIELHLIGPLQTNKARRAVELFDVIETVDRPKLARHLARLMTETGRRLPIYVQVNTGDEAQKAGVALDAADGLIALCREELGLEVAGLMCIPPVGESPAPHFALLRKIAARNGVANLSMGMSADFATAIGFGATHVRVGTAIFGARPPLTQS